MNADFIIDAVGHLDLDLISDHIKQKEEMIFGMENTKKASKKRNIIKWCAAAACFALVLCLIPVLRTVIGGSHTNAPVSVEYKNIDAAHDALGRETLYSGLDFVVGDFVSAGDGPTVSVSYRSDNDGEAVLDEPLQLLIRQPYAGNGSSGTVHCYVLFGKDDINDCMIGGYEEMGLEKETGGITVHYSEIFDGANHVQARFISDGDLYVIDITSKDAIDLDSFLEKILK